MTTHQYTGPLARPLRSGEKPEDKIADLKNFHSASSDRDALVEMMIRHVIKKQAKQYPLALRSAPKRGKKPEDRIPDLKAHLGVSSDGEALLELAKRHVPGFKPSRRGGRPPRGGESGEFDFQREAKEALVLEAMEDRLGDKNLSLKECAKRVSRIPGHPLSGASPEYIIERYNHRKRSERQFGKELEERLVKLKSLLK